VNQVIHFEIPANDRVKSRGFYTRVFDWKILDVPMKMNGSTGTYTTATTVSTDPKTMTPTEPGAINGAIRDRTGTIRAPVIVVMVDSIDKHLKIVTEAGCKIVEGKQTIEGLGHYAYVADPDGNVIGLWENMRA
jgi:uncharacterized protein